MELNSLEILIESIRRCLPQARICANCQWWRKERNNYGKIEYFCVANGSDKIPTGALHGCSCFSENEGDCFSFKRIEAKK